MGVHGIEGAKEAGDKTFTHEQVRIGEMHIQRLARDMIGEMVADAEKKEDETSDQQRALAAIGHTNSQEKETQGVIGDVAGVDGTEKRHSNHTARGRQRTRDQGNTGDRRLARKEPQQEQGGGRRKNREDKPREEQQNSREDRENNKAESQKSEQKVEQATKDSVHREKVQPVILSGPLMRGNLLTSAKDDKKQKIASEEEATIKKKEKKLERTPLQKHCSKG